MGNLSSTNSSTYERVTTSNKSGYSATFIVGSTVSIWHLPVHIQTNSEAKVENKIVNTFFPKIYTGSGVSVDSVK